MDSIFSSYAFWVLTVIHVVAAIELIYFKICYKHHSPQVFNVSTTKMDNKSDDISGDTLDLTYNPYMSFPNMSSKTVITALKVNNN